MFVNIYHSRWALLPFQPVVGRTELSEVISFSLLQTEAHGFHTTAYMKVIHKVSTNVGFTWIPT